MKGTILRGKDLLGRFKNLLTTHTHVDIATAWVTGGRHLRALADAANRESRGVRVRAIVGVAGKATRPDALEELNKVTGGDLRIVPDGDRLFHPKVYLFGRGGSGIVTRQAWIGSANFTNAGFSGLPRANEEIMLEVEPGESTDALASWFERRWSQCPMNPPVAEMIRRYTEEWKRSPPHPNVQQNVSGLVSRRSDLLDDAHRPLTLEGYRQALRECEKTLRDEGWEIFNPQGRSYTRVISRRRELLLGDMSWSRLDGESQTQLKGGWLRTHSDWWGLMGRMGRSNWPAVLRHEAKIRGVLDRVVEADDGAFPDIAVTAIEELTNIDYVGYGTATLLVTLARPDRLLSLNGASKKGLGSLSGLSHWTLGKPKNYRKLLRWLYDQPWYGSEAPTDEDLALTWQFRAALVDAFVYEWT